jgi:hypothetical protein
MERFPQGGGVLEPLPQPSDLSSHYAAFVQRLAECRTSRRSVLLGAVGASAGLPLVGALARAATNFTCHASDDAVRIDVAGIPAWTIDRRWFDGTPQLELRQRANMLRVRLRKARFPGTSVAADLLLEARRVDAGWAGRIVMDALGFAADFPFHTWLLGHDRARGKVNLHAFDFRAARDLRLTGIQGAATFGADWILDLPRIEDGAVHFGAQRSSVAALRVELARFDASAVDLERSKMRLTHFWPVLQGASRIDFGKGSPRADMPADAARMHVAASRDVLRLRLRRDGAGSRVQWGADDASSVLLPADDLDVALHYASGAARLEGSAGMSRPIWHQGEHFHAEFVVAGGTVLLASNAPSSSCECPIYEPSTPFARRFVVSVPGCDQALFEMRSRATGIVEGLSADVTGFAVGRVCLDCYDLTLRRATDALAVTLRFRNVDLELTGPTWMLLPREGTKDDAYVEYDFGSQHVLEPAVYVSDWCDGALQAACSSDSEELPVADEIAADSLKRAANASDPTYPMGWNILAPALDAAFPAGHGSAWLLLQVQTPLAVPQLLDKLYSSDDLRKALGTFCRSPELRRYLGFDAKELPARATRAGSSHLVFRLKEQRRVPMNVGALFAWAEGGDVPGSATFELVLPERAKAVGTVVLENETQDQRQAPVITRPLRVHEAMASGVKATSGIEVPARLVMSPIEGDTAKWAQSRTNLRVASGTSSGGRNELWSVRLVGTRMRAVYTPDASSVEHPAPQGSSPDDVGHVKVDIFNPPIPYYPKKSPDGFRASLDARDRHELVALSSLYGFDSLWGSHEVANCHGRGIGQFIPTPVEVPLIQLTSLGANFKYRGRWDPPASSEPGKGALSVTRWNHHGQIGRDIKVRVEYKGFLFPLGLPVTLVKMTERRFCLATHPRSRRRQLVAKLVQRFFIQCEAFTRSSMVGQPQEGRYWPHASTSIDEVTTPDLMRPDLRGVKNPYTKLDLGQNAFFVTGLCGQPILFEFKETTTGTRYSAPMVFVDNNVAHSDRMLRVVIDDWRTKVNLFLTLSQGAWPDSPQWGIASVLSGRVPYVKGVRGDNTDLETDAILLSVQTASDQHYDDDRVSDALLSMSPQMEAQRQPPFYPCLRRGRVTLTQVSTLTGNSGARYLLEYDAKYGAVGLAGATNSAQIFGDFVDQLPVMSFGGNTSRSGGFASPSTSMVYASATRGLIGGATGIALASPTQPIQSPPNPDPPQPSYACPAVASRRPSAVTAMALPASPPPPASPDVYNGDFDPKAFFATFIGDAKLLGVVRIVDILEIALAASGTKIPTIHQEDLYALAEDALRAVLPVLKTGLGRVLGMFDDSSLPAAVASRLRPGIVLMQDGLTALDATLASSPVDDATMLSQVGAFGKAAESVVAQAKAIAKEPSVLLPPEFQETVQKMAGVLDALRKLDIERLLRDEARQLAQSLLDQVIATAIQRVSDTIASSPEFDSLLGTLQDLQDQLKSVAARLVNAGLNLIAEVAPAVDALLKDVDEALRIIGIFAQVRADAVLIGKAADLQRQLFVEVGDFARLKAEDLDALKKTIGTWVTSVGNVVALHEQDLAAQTGLAPDTRADAERALAAARQAASAMADGLTDSVNRLQAIVNGTPQRKAASASTARRLGGGIKDTDFFVFIASLDFIASWPQRVITQTSRLMEVIDDVMDYRAIVVSIVVPNPWADCDHLGQELVKAFRVFMSQVGAQLHLSSMAAHEKNIANMLKGLSDPLKGWLDPVAQAADAAAGALRDLDTGLASGGGLLDVGSLCGNGQRHLAKTSVSFAPQLPALQDFARRIDELAQFFTWSLDKVSTLSPEAVTAQLKLLQSILVTNVQNRIDAVAANILQGARSEIPQVVDALGKLLTNASPYLAADLAADLRDLRVRLVDFEADGGRPALTSALESLRKIGDRLASAASVQGIGKLVDLNQILDELVASLGLPTRVRVTYDWATDVHEFPDGDGAIFEPQGDGTLTIHAAVEAGLAGGAPTATMSAELSPFQINLFGRGDSNFLTVKLDALKLELPPGGKLTCHTNVQEVIPGEALGFVQALESLFGGDSGYVILPTFSGIKVGYEFHEDMEQLGGFVLQNIAFAIYADLPFDNSPVRITMNLAERTKPFLISAGIYGGGGFLAIRTRADTLELLEASFEYGLVTGFKFGVLTGSGRITAGIYIRMGGQNPAIEGFFCADGEVSLAGLITMGATLRVTLDYFPNTNSMVGAAEYSFHFKIGFLKYTYSVTVEYLKKGDGGGKSSTADAAHSSTLALAQIDEGPDRSDVALPSFVTSDAASGDEGAHPWDAQTWRRCWAMTTLHCEESATARSTCTPRSVDYA